MACAEWPPTAQVRGRAFAQHVPAPGSRTRPTIGPVRATTIYGPHDIRLEEVPDPHLVQPTDAIVKVVAACVCGSDLWRYRGVVPVKPGSRIGHEFVGVVQEVGDDVRTVAPGDFVVAPFSYSCGECVNCRNGVQTSCVRGGFWAGPDRDGDLVDGGQGELRACPAGGRHARQGARDTRPRSCSPRS